MSFTITINATAVRTGFLTVNGEYITLNGQLLWIRANG